MVGRLSFGNRNDDRPITPSKKLKQNKYENPKSALDLISHICTSGISFELSKYENDISDFFTKWESKTKDPESQEKSSWFNTNLFSDVRDNCFKHLKGILDNPYDTIHVAVAGGYSAGKSRLLNKIADLQLPTGVEPVSVVNTKIVCDKEVSKSGVRASNLHDQKVALNTDVLECIQHSKKTNVYVASVLKSISIYRPTNVDEAIEGITFVDTPGYNNSIAINKENNKSDQQTALEAIDEADALIWCIDIEGGTIPSTDISMLSEIENTPIVICFTQMDKKPKEEVGKILKAAKRVVEQRLNGLPIIKIMAYSAQEGEGVVLDNQGELNTQDDPIDSMIKDIKGRCCKGSDVFARTIEKRIGEELSDSENKKKFWEKQRIDIVKQKDEVYEQLRINNKVIQEDLQTFEKIVALAHHVDRSDNMNWVEQLKCNFDEYVKRCSQANNDVLEEIKAKLVDIKYQKQAEEKRRTFWSEFKIELHSFLKEQSERLKGEYFRNVTRVEEIEATQSIDIFTAIQRGDYESFIQCFHNGQDISAQKNGYTPFTLAVKEGNNQMVRFFLDNNISALFCDGNGFNAFETAVINHYQDLCEDILKDCKEKNIDIVKKSRPLKELFAMNTFENYINNL